MDPFIFWNWFVVPRVFRCIEGTVHWLDMPTLAFKRRGRGCITGGVNLRRRLGITALGLGAILFRSHHECNCSVKTET